MRYGHQDKVKQLFAEPFATDILLELLERNGQTRGELEGGICTDEPPGEEPPKKVSLEKALELLLREDLIKEEGGEVKLTSKGVGVAEILDRIEDMFPSCERQRRLIVPKGLSGNRLIGYYE